MPSVPSATNGGSHCNRAANLLGAVWSSLVASTSLGTPEACHTVCHYLAASVPEKHLTCSVTNRLQTELLFICHWIVMPHVSWAFHCSWVIPPQPSHPAPVLYLLSMLNSGQAVLRSSFKPLANGVFTCFNLYKSQVAASGYEYLLSLAQPFRSKAPQVPTGAS